MATTQNSTLMASTTIIAVTSLNFNISSESFVPNKPRVALPDHLFQQVANVYLMPIMVIVGLVCNILVVMVMRDTSFRRLPLKIYFTVLAISDSAVLILLGTKQMLRYGFKINILKVPLACHMIDNILGFFVAYSAWIIVCVAGERALVVSFPLKAKQISTINKSKLACFIVSLPLIPLSTINIFLADYSAKICTYFSQYIHFATVGRGWIVLIPFNLLPFIILCFCYVVLIWKLVTGSKEHVTSNKKYVERLTVTSLVICTTFFIFTSPTAIFILLSRLNGWKKNTPLGPRIASTTLFMIRLLNYATNFPICVVTNVTFRQAFLRMWKKGSVAPETSVGSMSRTNRNNSKN